MSWGADGPDAGEVREIERLQREINRGRAVNRDRARVAAPLARARAEQARVQYVTTARWRLVRRYRLLQEFMDESMAAEVLSAASCGRFGR